MPAPKRGPTPHDSQPKIRKLDEDGEALPSKTAPATNSLKTGNMPEKTAASRTKKKRSSSVERENKPAKSSKQSSPSKDSIQTTTDPPVNKAKLLKATSASSEKAPSQRANSDASFKRTASTESDDDDVRSDGSKVDFFRERDDEDKARCIRKYSNKVKAKRKDEESSYDPQEERHDLPSTSVDPVQMDHNYGRFSDSPCLQNMGESYESKESGEYFTESKRQETSDNSVTAEISVGSEVKENEQKDTEDSIISKNDVDNDTIASSEETQDSVAGEMNSVDEGGQHVVQRTDPACKSEIKTNLDTQVMSEENMLSINCKTNEFERDRQCVTEETGAFGNQRDGILDETHANETNSVDENPTTEQFAGNSETETDFRVTFKEHLTTTETQDQVSDTVSSLCDDVNKTVGKSYEKLDEHNQEDLGLQSSQAAALGALAEVQLSQGILTADSGADTEPHWKAAPEQNQSDSLSESCVVPQSEVTLVMDVQSQENHLLNEEVPAEAKEDSTNVDTEKETTLQNAAAVNSQINLDLQASNPDITVETLSQVAPKTTTNLTTNFHESSAGENGKIMENKETMSFECENKMKTQTVATSEISCPKPTVEAQEQEIRTVTDVYREIYDHDTIGKHGNTETHENTPNSDCQSGMEMQAMEAQIQQSPVSEPATVIFDPETVECKDFEDVEYVTAAAKSQRGMDLHATDPSGEVCNMTQTREADCQIQQVVSEPSIPDARGKSLETAHCQNSYDTKCVAAAKGQIKVDKQTVATSKDTCNIKRQHGPVSQVDREATTDIIEVQKELELENCKRSEDAEYVSTAAENQMIVELQIAATSEVHDVTPVVEADSQMVSEPVTDISTELDGNLDLENLKPDNDEVNLEFEARIQSEIGEETQSSSIMKDSDPAPLGEINKMGTELTVQTQEDSSVIVSAVEIQSEKSWDDSAQATGNTLKEIHDDLMTGNSQSLKKEDEINSAPMTVQENEIEMEMQLSSASEISNQTPLLEMQSGKSQNEEGLQTSALTEQDSPTPAVGIQEQTHQNVTAQSFGTPSVTVTENQNKMDTEPESKPEMHISPTSAESQQCPEGTEPAKSIGQQDEGILSTPANENENRTVTVCISTSESPDEMETQTAETLEETSQPAAMLQTQGQEVTAVTTNTGVENDYISAECKQSVDAEIPVERDVQTVASEETSDSRFGVDIKNQDTPEKCIFNQNEERVAFEHILQSHAKMETSAGPEETSHPAVVTEQNHVAEEVNEHIVELKSEIQKPVYIVNLEHKENDRPAEPVSEDVPVNVDVISESIERADLALEQETGGQVINEVKTDQSVTNSEEAESNKVIVFVCDQPDETDIVIQPSEDQIKVANQQEIEFQENQVVYEPISSPECDGDGEVYTITELGEVVSLLEMQSAVNQHRVDDVSNFYNNDTKETADHIKLESEENLREGVPDSHAVIETDEQAMTELQCPAQAELEQRNTTPVGMQIIAVGSRDHTVVTGESLEDASEHSEKNVLQESSEQVQGDAGPEETADIPVTTTPAPTEVEVRDVPSEAYVILEPVPESEIQFDIVTQAAAESGLSPSHSEVASAGGILVDRAENLGLTSSSQPMTFLEGAQQCESANEVKDAEVTLPSDIVNQETKTVILEEVQNSDHLSSDTMDTEMANSHAASDAVIMENNEGSLELQQVQILEDMEIGHEIVVAESDSPEKAEDEKKGKEVEKPKKQEMNTQARTKARLAALAEKKAAESKRAAHRQQLNLLALCQEIAEDIATDSMLLKRIEEEKQAAAAAAAKAESNKVDCLPIDVQDEDPVSVATPAGPEGSSISVAPAPEAPAAEPSTATLAETKTGTEPQKRRFFVSQISVPLKAHEKKKLTRYQRLRQVELQREKMSWARVKKLKSDQANQMFSDVDWQAPFSASSLFLSSLAPATPPPATSPSKTPPASPATPSKPAQPKADAPKTEAPKAELVKMEATKSEPAKSETAQIEPAKTTCKKGSVKAETTKTEPPAAENRRTTRQSKAQASKPPTTPEPAPKVTRSTAKRTLPAVPPPMPNGVNAQKPKLEVEYKPYRPRPKYSPDDFELDEDPLPVRPAKSTPPMQPPRPRPQSKPTPPLKPTASSQLANQTQFKAQTTPPRQISGQSKPTVVAQAQVKPAQSKPTQTAAPQVKSTTAATSKPASSASVDLKSAVLTAAEPKAAAAPGQPRPAVSSSIQSKTVGASATQSKQSAPTAAQLAVSATCVTKTDVVSVPQKRTSPPSQEEDNCKNTALKPASSHPSAENSGDSQKCEEKPAVISVEPSQENKMETAQTDASSEKPNEERAANPPHGVTPLSQACLQKEVKKLKEAESDSSQTIIDAGQKHFGAVACSVCGMLYSAANPEDESQHLLFHNQFISAVKYVGWKKERILAEYPDGKIILVLPDDPKYALKKVEEIREMVDNDLGFQQVETRCPSQTKTFLFISVDKKVAGCLIAEHIQEGYRVIEDPLPDGSEGEKVMFERQRAWCCSTTPEPAICGISRIWVVGMMRRQGIASRMLECLRNNFIYGSYLSKDEIAFSDPTPDGKLFATHYFGTSQFLVYNFVSGTHPSQPKTHAV